MREEVDYFYYMEWGTPDEIARQATRRRASAAISAYYIKAGVDERREEEMLEALRDSIGPRRQDPDRRQPGLDRSRQARGCSSAGISSSTIDFVEAPVRIDPIENMLDLTAAASTCRSASMRACGARPMPTGIIKSRCGDYLCFSQYWVGSLGRWHMLNHAEPSGRLAGLQAHPWRVRPHRRGRPARHAGHPMPHSAASRPRR